MLKELNKLCFQSRCQVAAWRRWNRKLPHNRVRRPRLRDEHGRRIGFGPPEPLPEPELHPCFTQKVKLPSGRWDVILTGGAVEAAYRQTRQPAPTPDAVAPLPISEAEIR